MQNTHTYNQTGLGRLAAVLLRQTHPSTIEEGRAALKGALNVYAPDAIIIDRAVSDYFRAR
jgi:hypothetical protein